MLASWKNKLLFYDEMADFYKMYNKMVKLEQDKSMIYNVLPWWMER